ncbi:MAG: hypothetical protein AB8G96_12280 [Phycisphaerales bacterium]
MHDALFSGPMPPLEGQLVVEFPSRAGAETIELARIIGPAGTLIALAEADAILAEIEPGRLDEDGVERRPEHAPIDHRRGTPDAPSLSRPEHGAVDVLVVHGWLAGRRDPLHEVRLLTDILRPGGHILLLEEDRSALRLHPPCPAFERSWRDAWRRRESAGEDRTIGRRLPELLHRSGCRLVASRDVPLGRSAGEPSFDDLIDVLIARMLGPDDPNGRPALIEADDEDRSAAPTALRRWAREPGASIWLSDAWSLGQRERP